MLKFFGWSIPVTIAVLSTAFGYFQWKEAQKSTTQNAELIATQEVSITTTEELNSALRGLTDRINTESFDAKEGDLDTVYEGISSLIETINYSDSNNNISSILRVTEGVFTLKLGEAAQLSSPNGELSTIGLTDIRNDKTRVTAFVGGFSNYLDIGKQHAWAENCNISFMGAAPDKIGAQLFLSTCK